MMIKTTLKGLFGDVPGVVEAEATIHSGGIEEFHLIFRGISFETVLRNILQQYDQKNAQVAGNKPKTAAEILDGVKAILGEREGNYDHPKRNFERIADFWNDYIKNRPDPSAPLGAEDVALMMILFKVAREEFKHGEDNLLDTIGYAVCALRCAE